MSLPVFIFPLNLLFSIELTLSFDSRSTWVFLIVRLYLLEIRSQSSHLRFEINIWKIFSVFCLSLENIFSLRLVFTEVYILACFGSLVILISCLMTLVFY